PSDRLKQRSHHATRSLASVIERASRAASSLDSLSRWKAMRCADLGPTPGRRPSSSMRSWTGPAYKVRGRASAAGSAAAEQAAKIAHGLLVQLAHRGDRVSDGGQDQVLEHLDVGGVDHFRVDGD